MGARRVLAATLALCLCALPAAAEEFLRVRVASARPTVAVTGQGLEVDGRSIAAESA